MIFKKLREDKRNFDRGNTDENKVLDATFFSAYKGKRVYRMAGFGGRSFCLGAMFISPKETAGNKDSVDIVRHEYGHTLQIEKTGILRYIFRIGIPSLFTGKFPAPDYYNQKTEITADVLGGVSRESHTEEAIKAGEEFLESLRRK